MQQQVQRNGFALCWEKRHDRLKDAEQKGRRLRPNARQRRFGAVAWNNNRGSAWAIGVAREKIPVAVLVVAAATIISLHLDWFSAGQGFSSFVMPAS
jgi:hypothetical protein